MLTFKPGVKTNSPLARILIALDRVFSSHGQDAIVTSLNDSRHKDGSKHGSDEAVDCRTWHLPRQPDPCLVGGEMSPLLAKMIQELQLGLGPGFDVVFETDIPGENFGEYKRRQHLHLEFDPKPGRES